MKTIETTAKVGPDRRLVIDIPREIPEGDHRVFLMFVDEPGAQSDQEAGGCQTEGHLEWENGLLVYTGEIPSDLDIRRLMELDREQRMLHVMLGGSDEDPL